MKALKIDVVNQQVTVIDIGKRPKLDFYYKTIGNGCEMIEMPVEFSNGDTMVCDEEARLFKDHAVGGFLLDDFHFPIINNAIIVGKFDDDDNLLDALTTPEDITKQIKWIDKDQAQLELL